MCLKTYIVQYKHSNGNGWAIINCPSPSFIENILKKQSKMLNVQVVSYSELRYFGEEMGLVYEGCITTIGQSPYDIAVANGFRGSVTEWLDSLKGEQGPQGEQGIQGIQGEVGPKGSDGQDGIGVPPGGNSGQYLKKKSNSDYDTEWYDVQGGGSGNVNSVNGKTGNVVLDANDVNALPNNTPLFSGNYNDLANKPNIPSALSQLTEDTTHRVVSDTEKTTWNNKSNFSGSYNDLTDKPTIPAEQVQSDWNQTDNSSKDFIKNKPTIPTIPTNVSAFNNDAGYLTQHQSLSDYVQKSQTTGLIKNDGTIDTNTYLTQHQDISGKADKSEMSVTDGTGTDADKTTITLKSGTSATVLKSHQDISGKQDTLVSGTNIKTLNGESILGSGNINIDISGKEDATSIVAPVNATDATLPITTLATEVGKYYRIDVAVETLVVTLPVMENVTTSKTVVLYLTGGTIPAVTISSTAPTGGSAPDVCFSKGYAIESGKTYEVNCLWNGASWIVASVEISLT